MHLRANAPHGDNGTVLEVLLDGTLLLRMPSDVERFRLYREEAEASPSRNGRVAVRLTRIKFLSEVAK